MKEIIIEITRFMPLITILFMIVILFLNWLLNKKDDDTGTVR